MIRNVRLVLCFLIGLFGWLFYLSITQAPTWDAKLVFGLFSGLPLLNAIIMFVSLRKGVRQDKDGLCLQSDHLLLKLSREMNSKDYFKPCPLYWKATGLELLICAIIGVLTLVSYWILIKPFYGSFLAWYLIIGVASVAGTIWLAKTTYNHFPKLQKFCYQALNILVNLFFGSLIVASGSSITVLFFFMFYDFGWLEILRILGIMIPFGIGIIILLASLAWSINKLSRTKFGVKLSAVEINLGPLSPRWCPPIKKCEEEQS